MNEPASTGKPAFRSRTWSVLALQGHRRHCFVQGWAIALAVLAAALVPAADGAGEDTVEIHVDCSRTHGEIRPLHGVNCGPIQYGEMVDLSAYHKELGIPCTRLHDCHWPNPDVVDVHAVFPDFAADPGLPESYDFRRTDDYIQAIVNVGSRIVYRLGESIEHSRRKYHVNPPPDHDKWAAVCVGIIRHYNEGWANGFHHDIRYWEIWNEPENRPAMWTGSDEDYFRLYEVAAKAIKARFPGLKVGGPSIGDSGRIVDRALVPSPFLLRFLEYCRARSLPLDFFSWHLYSDDPWECTQRARDLRNLLDRSGFTRTELHFNEWNYLPGKDWTPMGLRGQGALRERFYEEIGGAPGAAFSACVLMALQDTPVDVANYYMADNQGFGLFSFHGVPKKTFYALKAFRMLLDTPLRLRVSGTQPGRLAVCAGAARDTSAFGILISNFKSASGRMTVTFGGLPWNGPTLSETYRLDEGCNLEKPLEARFPPGDPGIVVELKAPAVCFIRIRAAPEGK